MSEEQKNIQQSQTDQPEVQEDRVAEDIRSAKKFILSLFSKVKKTTQPAVASAKKTVSTKTSPVTGKVKKRFNMKIIKRVVMVLFVIFVALGFLYLSFSFLKKVSNGNGQDDPSENPTPTPVSYQPYQPSVYATDEIVLQLEEDIDVLVREISGTRIKESILVPPEFNFTIRY